MEVTLCDQTALQSKYPRNSIENSHKQARIFSLSNRLELAVQAIADAKHFVTEGFLLDDVVKLIIYGVYAQVFVSISSLTFVDLKAQKADLEGTLEGARNVYEILVKNRVIT